MKIWKLDEVRALRKGVAPRAPRAQKKRYPKPGEVVVASTEMWVAECAGGVMVMHGYPEIRGIGFLGTETLEALVKRGEPVPLGPLPEIAT